MNRTCFFVGSFLLALAASHAPGQTRSLPLQGAAHVRPDHQADPHVVAALLLPTPSRTDAIPAAPDAPSPYEPANRQSADQPICGITHLVRCIQDLGQDDKGIFTSPLRLQPKDAYWLAPLGAATGFAFAYDADAAQAAGVDPNRTNTANTIADFGSFFATGAEGAGIYFVGLAQKNPKLTETGRLGAEAVIDSGTVTLATKLVTNRQRPRQGNGRGGFWPFGTSHYEWDSSFPSDHATASMALARIIAGEYPRWYVVAPAYGFAEMIAISRILANQHFPSDVLVGQAIGFLSATYVLNHRALYRPGAKKTFASQLIESVHPIADPRTRALGASMDIPFGR